MWIYIYMYRRQWIYVSIGGTRHAYRYVTYMCTHWNWSSVYLNIDIIYIQYTRYVYICTYMYVCTIPYMYIIWYIQVCLPAFHACVYNIYMIMHEYHYNICCIYNTLHIHVRYIYVRRDSSSRSKPLARSSWANQDSWNLSWNCTWSRGFLKYPAKQSGCC